MDGTRHVNAQGHYAVAGLACLAFSACGGGGSSKDRTDTGEPTPSVDCGGGDLSCNGVDDDCDGVTDEPDEVLLVGWMDRDGDRFGGGDALEGCAALSADLWTGGDCDDADPDVHPGAWDRVGDGLDADCSGADRTCVDGPLQLAVDGDLVLSGDEADAVAADACAAGDWVRGAVLIENTDWQDLRALSCLCGVDEGVQVLTAPSLRTLDGLSPDLHMGLRVDLRFLPVLHSIAALGAMRWAAPLRNPAQLVLQDLPSLGSLDGMDGLTELDDLVVRGDVPADLGALATLAVVWQSLELRQTERTDIAGLDGLVRVGELRVEEAPNLHSLAPLDGLERVRFLTLSALPINNLDDFAALTRVDRRLTVAGMSGLTDLSGLPALTVLGGLYVLNNPALTSLAGLPEAVDAVDGDLVLVGNVGLDSPRGLGGLRWLGGDLVLGTSDGPSHVTSLVGLEGLEFIGGSLRVDRAPALQSLAGLDNLIEIGGDVVLTSVFEPSIASLSLAGVPALHTIHGGLVLYAHDRMVDLQGLESLARVGVIDMEANPMLRSTQGLSGLEDAGEVLIFDNDVMEDIVELYRIDHVDGAVCVEVPGSTTEPEAWLASLGRVNGC